LFQTQSHTPQGSLETSFIFIIFCFFTIEFINNAEIPKFMLLILPQKFKLPPGLLKIPPVKVSEQQSPKFFDQGKTFLPRRIQPKASKP